MATFTPVPKADLKDPAFLEHCRELCRLWRVPCFISGVRDGTIVPHHVRPKAVWGDKNNVVFLSSAYHVERNDSAHRLGSYIAFDAKHGCDLVAEAFRIYQEYLRIYRPKGEDSEGINTDG